jgi:heme/copper-type cytochrome/quinol oxidase subunit 2
MNFVDWNNDDGNVIVSGYVWIYVVVTVFFTGITIGLWYFFVVYRRTNRVVGDEEDPASMMHGFAGDAADEKKNAIGSMARIKRLFSR